LNQISTNKGKHTTKIQEVLVLKEKIQILESQLKIKEHQALLEKSQLEESVKRTQSILFNKLFDIQRSRQPCFMYTLDI
jgi:hypothetical protein